MLLIVNTVLGSCKYGNCVGSTFYSPVYCLYLYAPLGTFNQNSPLPQSQCFRSACEDPIDITFSDRTFTCFSLNSSPTLLRTLSPRWSPRDLPPQRRRRRRMPTPPPPLQQQQLRRWRRARAAMVFPACTRTSACWFLQCCAAWYVNAHLIPAISTEPHMHWHGVCRPKQHPTTFSDSTPRCCGWNSSPSQCCASRSVHEHHISDIDMLYQPITLKCKIQ